MTTITRPELLERIIEAVERSGWNVIYDRIGDRPFKLQIHNQNEVRRLRIYIWNISHGGGARRPADEYRIQVHVPRFEPEDGWQVLILGWWEDGQVFAGFDYRKHSGNLGKSASLQIKLEALEAAAINGFAPSDKGNQEIAIAFKPEYFVDYANHTVQFHSFGQSRPDLAILQSVAANQEQLQNNDLLNQVSNQRRRALQTISRALRDRSFSNRILTAYTFRCAFCNIQLNLIDAAHIVPVSHENSTDETRNGIALCGLHHKAYDNALVTFNENYQIVTSENRLAILKQIDRAGEEERFIHDLRPVINVPPASRDRPHITYVIRANRIRGW
jgi:putative restriction endonuclease